MNNNIKNFLNYLLDTETTSEISFIETIQKHNELFQTRYIKDWEQIILRKLEQVHPNTIISSLNAVDNSQKSENGSTSSEHDDETDEEDDDEEQQQQQKSTSNGHFNNSTKGAYIYTDIVRQCQRLLRFLHYCQQHHPDFTEFYFCTLEQCIKNDNEKFHTIALQQIASHLFEGTKTDDEYQRLIKYIPSNSSPTIQSLLNTNKTEYTNSEFLSNHIDILYPYTSHFIDVRREFRDTTHYLIDGDSLLLSLAHHTNLNLNSYYGNTIHLIFLIEKFLLTLFQQSNQCNYTLVFFDCHYQIYQSENSILNLIRSCLIRHISNNINQYEKCKIEKFSSWTDKNYLEFVQEEKPMFMFYHDMSTFDLDNNALLSKTTLEKLLCIYRFFGNYHQYIVQCQLYLMNKLILNETMVKCFHIEFNRMCSKDLLNEMIQIYSKDVRGESVRKEKDWSKLDGNDLRLFLYLQTIDNFNQENLLQSFIPLLILHIALLIRLSINDRHLPLSFPTVTYSSMCSQFIGKFQQDLAMNLNSCSSTLSSEKIADLFDGRLFTFTLYQIHGSANIRLDEKTVEIVKQSLDLLDIPFNENTFQDAVNQLVQSNDIIFSSSASENNRVSSTQQQKVLKITNPFIKTYLEPILSSSGRLPFELIEPDHSHVLQYRGRQYWPTYKEVGEEISRIKDNNDDKRPNQNPRYRTKNQQQLYNFYDLYGRALATRDFRDDQLQIVLPTASTPVSTNKENTDDQSDSVASASASNKKKQPHKNQPKKNQVSKADLIKQQNSQRLSEKRTNDENDKLHHVENRLKQIPNDNYPEAIELIDECLPNFTSSTTRLDLLKRKFEYQRKYLRILKRKKDSTLEDQSKIELLQIAFFATLCEMTHIENIVDAFTERKKYMEELVDDSALDKERWYRFQLEKINSRLPRREQGIKDDRVPDFTPDAWQVQFLDAVDKRKSIIIVAPTASGKTYASYYAMRRVLTDKDDSNGICVYIAPTKALINQVAATIHTKFGPYFGVFTTEYRMNVEKCRILVTVPECFEMLLLSPEYQAWCQRIRYCIFDEIHCMSGDIGSDVWERTMLLINCPMIGLSATVNNGGNLAEWIRNVEQQRYRLFQTGLAREVCLITHDERLADLNKYLYSNRQLYPIHPIGLMNAKQLTTRGIPNDFSLSPYETLRLNDTMQKNHIQSESIPTLTDYFSPGWIIERNHCNQYSQLVRKQFTNLITNNQNSTIDSISSSLNPTESNKISYPERKPMSSLIGEFVLTLKEKNLLPCIVFTDSRALCEELAECVTQYFEELEKDLRRTKYKYQIEAIEKRLSLIEKQQKSSKAKKASKTSGKRNNDEEDTSNDKPADIQKMEEEDESYNRLSGHEQELLSGILDECTLADRRHSDREFVDQLIARAASVNTRLERYLRRGVAYHHARLRNKERLPVEGLFRSRYVQIVFSTWTLALGVHMPTKTVAFVKDSIQLDALQYRQSSGRAGRRGFDVQGNIIFIDIPLPKIRHLTISAIPNIQTHFPTSISFILRLLYLYSNAQDKKDACNRSLIALQYPFNSQSHLTHDLIDLQLRYHYFYTLDFLYRLNLINYQGDLIGLAGFLIHLHDFEPSSILFVYLLTTKLFHQINDEEQIVNLLANLFTNRPWCVTHSQRNLLFNPKLALRTLPSDIQQRIQSYNTLVKQTYGQYIKTVIEKLRSLTNNNSSEYILPYSNISFYQASDYDNGTFEYTLHHHHSQQSENPSISPFAGPSGLTHEQYMSNFNPATGSWDLAYNLDLSSRIIPYVDIDARDHTNACYYLNSYAFDFFKQGSEKVLMTENELDRGETFNLLSEFRRLLTSIKISTGKVIENETNDLPFFKPLGKKFLDIEQNFSTKFFREFK